MSIIIASTTTTDSAIECGFCSSPLEHLDISAREEHYERHLAEDSAQTNRVLKSGRRGENYDAFWYRAKPSLPPPNYTPGLICLLKKALWHSHAKGAARRAVLCYEGSVHVGHESWDRGWGCGYRNYLMACTALMDQSIQPTYLPLLGAPTPGIRNLQALIQNAWKDGFDQVGAKDLKKLVGSRKWVGTADLWVAFTYLGIPAELVDFELNNESRGVELVVDWIVDYFSPKLAKDKPANINDALRGASPIVVTDRMPLILQHSGHSRTVIGYEISKTGKVNLLMFDPSLDVGQETRNAAISLHDLSLPSASTRHPLGPHVANSQPRTDGGRQPNLDKILNHFKLSAEKLRKKQYQILYFPMKRTLTTAEKMGKTVVTSTKYGRQPGQGRVDG